MKKANEKKKKMALLGFKFPLRLREGQEKKILALLGACRFVWNRSLRFERRCLKLKGRLMNPEEEALLLDLLLKKHEFLRAFPRATLARKIRDAKNGFHLVDKDLEKPEAMRRGMRPPTEKGRGVFPKARFGEGEFRILGEGKAQADGLGVLRFKAIRSVAGGRPLSMTISYDGFRFQASFLVDLPSREPLASAQGAAVGLDVGVRSLAALSDGRLIPSFAKAAERHAKKARWEKRRLARKVKGSKNWEKQLARYRRAQKRVDFKIGDHLEKETSRIAREHSLVVVEDLRWAALAAKCGKTDRERARLNAARVERFMKHLQVKAALFGSEIQRVNPTYSSQECSACGSIDSGNRPGGAEIFHCLRCGHEENADIQAAKNLLNRGLGKKAQGNSSAGPADHARAFPKGEEIGGLGPPSWREKTGSGSLPGA